MHLSKAHPSRGTALGMVNCAQSVSAVAAFLSLTTVLDTHPAERELAGVTSPLHSLREVWCALRDSNSRPSGS
jgi:hypothetical protein